MNEEELSELTFEELRNEYERGTLSTLLDTVYLRGYVDNEHAWLENHPGATAREVIDRLFTWSELLDTETYISQLQMRLRELETNGKKTK
jgi:hypothetical protein